MRVDSPLVELKGVAKGYIEGEHQRAVFQSLSASFAAGAITAIVGRSGTGKSTLLNLLSGIDSPDAGEITVCGAQLGRLSEKQRTLHRREHIGFIFQFFNLLPTLNVEENLCLPAQLVGRTNAQATARALDLLQEVGLADRASSFPDRLSGGEQQRIAIARALMHEPALILADEPTGNLDADSSARVLDLLTRLVREDGRSLIMVTHSDEAVRRADHVYAIEDGRLHENASVS